VLQAVLPVEGLHGASFEAGTCSMQPWSGMFALLA
jgi:hypothetical protein